jgi:hypothetical protein
MVILAILTCLAAVGLLCWLLFKLAVFALPIFVGVTTGAWAHGVGAGISGAVLIGVVAAAMTVVAGHLLVIFARPVWLKLILAAALVAPAAIAGFHATHGIVKYLTPSDAWQITFSIMGAIAVGISALVRVVALAVAPGQSGRGLAGV